MERKKISLVTERGNLATKIHSLKEELDSVSLDVANEELTKRYVFTNFKISSIKQKVEK